MPHFSVGGMLELDLLIQVGLGLLVGFICGFAGKKLAKWGTHRKESRRIGYVKTN